MIFTAIWFPPVAVVGKLVQNRKKISGPNITIGIIIKQKMNVTKYLLNDIKTKQLQ